MSPLGSDMCIFKAHCIEACKYSLSGFYVKKILTGKARPGILNTGQSLKYFENLVEFKVADVMTNLKSFLLRQIFFNKHIKISV